MKQYCASCNIKEYCDTSPADCPLAKEYKQIADFEEAKARLKKELIKSFEKYFSRFEEQTSHIKNKLKGGD